MNHLGERPFIISSLSVLSPRYL